MKMTSLFSTSAKKSFCCSSTLLSISLLACGVAMVVIGIHWDVFKSNDQVLYEIVDGDQQVIGVKKTTALLWASFLVMPSCIVGIAVVCSRKKSMFILLGTTAAIACVGAFIASVKSRQNYGDLRGIAADDYDDRCEDNSYNDVNYCECKMEAGEYFKNQTRIWRFQVEECDDIEKKTKRMFLFFLLNVVSTCFSFALFLVAIMACCSTSEQEANLLQQRQTMHYNSIKLPEDGPPYSSIYPNIKQNADHGHQDNNVGFCNPDFTQGGEQRKVFWYPYSGAPEAGNEAVGHKLSNRGSEINDTVTRSSFTKMGTVSL